MELKINNETYEVSDERPFRPLLWVLRDELGLTGTKFGCGAGICGACTVHVDGVATRSCVTQVSTVADKEIRTIEGMASTLPDGTLQLHPVQQAFLEGQVPQCSWCMSGQMMTAAAFLEENPQPNREEITEAMKNNYCRCGCYVRVRDAVGDAATKIAQAKAGVA